MITANHINRALVRVGKNYGVGYIWLELNFGILYGLGWKSKDLVDNIYVIFWDIQIR